jgi:hypothetical protein
MLMRTIIFALGLAILATNAASADPPQQPPSAGVAKMCRELTVKKYPPVLAGSAKGDAVAQRGYFASCIKNGGLPDK